MTISSRIKSLPARAGAFFVDVKEVKSIRSIFNYNYYKSDEKVFSDSDIEVSPNASIINYNTARYIKVDIEKPNFDETQNEDDNITFTVTSNSVLESFFQNQAIEDDMIFTENDFGGNIFTGIKASIPNEISILRNLIQETTMAIISPVTSSMQSSLSPTDFIRSFSNMANTEGFLFSRQSKSRLDKFFTNISSEALGEGKKDPGFPFLGYSFSGNYNSLILNDIEKSVSENSTSIFANAINDIKSQLKSIQSIAITEKNDQIPISNYYPVFDSDKVITDQSDIDILFGDTPADYNSSVQLFRNIRHIGYRVNVRFFLDNGKVINLTPRIFKNMDMQEIYITNPPYGSQASISVEPIYAIQLPAQNITASGITVLTKCLIYVAGSGKKTLVNVIDTVPPPPPQDLNFNLTRQGLEINWSLPFNKQRDITKFRIYRRSSKDEPFTMIKQIDFDPKEETEIPSFLNDKLPEGTVKTFYLDRSFSKESKYIYAISCVDVHGLLSDYSEQISVSINPVFNRLETKLFARIGAFLSYPNSTIEKQIFDDVIKSSGYTKMNIYFNPDFLQVYHRLENGTENMLLDITPNQQKKYKINLINIDLQQKQNLDIIITEGINASPFDSGDSAIVRSFLE